MVLLALVQWAFPPPFVVERPGPVVDTLGTVQTGKAGEDPQPMIQIEGAETYPTQGQLNLLTVSIQGGPDRSVGWLGLIPALLDPSQEIVPMEQIFPPGVSSEDREAQNEQLMDRSQADATVAALRQLGTEVPATVSVSAVVEGSPAAGVLKETDELLRVNGTEVLGVEQLRRLIAQNGADQPAEIVLRRDGQEQTVAVTPVASGTQETPGPAVLGIGVASEYDFPFDVDLADQRHRGAERRDDVRAGDHGHAHPRPPDRRAHRVRDGHDRRRGHGRADRRAAAENVGGC